MTPKEICQEMVDLVSSEVQLKIKEADQVPAFSEVGRGLFIDYLAPWCGRFGCYMFLGSDTGRQYGGGLDAPVKLVCGGMDDYSWEQIVKRANRDLGEKLPKYATRDEYVKALKSFNHFISGTAREGI